MISLTNHDFHWGRSEVVIIYPEELQIPGRKTTSSPVSWTFPHGPSNLQPHRPSKSVVPDDRCSAVPTSGSFLWPTPWYVVYLYLYVIIHIIYNIYI